MRTARVVISRPWEGAEVLSFVTESEIGVQMDLDIFLHVLAQESKISPSVLTKAAEKITAIMKAQTAKVVL